MIGPLVAFEDSICTLQFVNPMGSNHTALCVHYYSIMSTNSRDNFSASTTAEEMFRSLTMT